MAAGLFLVATLSVGTPTNGFAIGNTRRLERDLRVVTLAQFVDEGFDVGLAGGRDEEFVGLLVAEEAQHRILFHELMDSGRELILVGAGLGFDGPGHGGFGKSDGLEENFVALVAESVAGKGFF